MKKIFMLTLIIFIFVGCGSSNNNEATFTIPEIFPFEENTRHILTSEQEIGNQEIFTTYVNGNRMQQKIVAPNNEITAVLEYDNGELRQIYSFLEQYLYEDLTDVQPNMNIVMLKEPLIVGNSWETGDSNGLSTITSVDEIIETPMGELETIEVTTEFRNGDFVTEYFAPGIGIVKTEYTTTTPDATINVTSFLNEVIRNEGLEVTTIFYYPDDMILNLTEEEKVLTIETNQDFTDLFENALREVPLNSEYSIINNETQINNITIDRELDVVIVDFTSNFLDNVGGAGYENLLLQGLAYTFGNFYSVGNFGITLDGNNYQSGHFYFEEDEFISIY